MLVMYTLRRASDGTMLLGPLNKRVYASFAPKRHVFAIARREADKRGFTKDCGKQVQLLTDGDEDLANPASVADLWSAGYDSRRAERSIGT